MKRGFTLIETVVTVGIVAAMAAVVIPQVAKQFDSADPTRIQNDFKNIQTAIETFSVNVKQLPGDLDDLVNTPGVAANEDSTITTAAAQVVFTSTASLFQGPYIDVSVLDLQDTDQTITTGYGALILDNFVCYDSGSNAFGVSEGSSGAQATDDQACPGVQSGVRYLAIQVTGIDCDETTGSVFMTINALFDPATELTDAETLGRVRCSVDGATTNTDVVYFLAVAIG